MLRIRQSHGGSDARGRPFVTDETHQLLLRGDVPPPEGDSSKLSRLVNLVNLEVYDLVVNHAALLALRHLTALKALSVDSIDPEMPAHGVMLPASLERLLVKRWVLRSLQPLAVVKALRVVPVASLMNANVSSGHKSIFRVNMSAADAADSDVQVCCFSLVILGGGRERELVGWLVVCFSPHPSHTPIAQFYFRVLGRRHSERLFLDTLI